MRSIGVRYLEARRQKNRTTWYWVPTKGLREIGFLVRRLPDDLPEAIAAARKLNAELDAWYAGELKPKGHKPGSLAALDDLFQRDAAFKRLKPRSQADHIQRIKAALAWAGDMPVKAISRRAIRVWHRALVEKRGETNARNAVVTLRRLLSFALDEEWIDRNPALAMRLPTPASRTRVWSLEERDAFIAVAEATGRPSMGLAVMLGWCIGQRPGDLRSLTWNAYDGRTIRLRQAKTGTDIAVPCLPELRELLDRVPRTAEQIVVSEATGRPYVESAFQHLFAELRVKARLPADLQFRDLRRTLATALGAAGCTDDQIRAVTGHQTRAVVAVYVRPNSTFAEGAMERLQASLGAAAERDGLDAARRKAAAE
jgi:integrase